MLENREDDVPYSCLLKPVNLARHANRARQKLCQKESEGLFFDIFNMTYVPESFIQDDVTVTGRRHIIFASQAMVSLLNLIYNVGIIYIDYFLCPLAINHP